MPASARAGSATAATRSPSRPTPRTATSSAASSARGRRARRRAPSAAATAEPLSSASGPGDVGVAGAERPAPRGQARTCEAHERQRLPGLALGRVVAAPDEGEAVEVERGDERVAELVRAGALRRDALVAADRLGEHAVVGDGVGHVAERAAGGRADRALELARAHARLRVARDARLDPAHEGGARGEAVAGGGAGARAPGRRRAAGGRLHAGQAGGRGAGPPPPPPAAGAG